MKMWYSHHVLILVNFTERSNMAGLGLAEEVRRFMGKHPGNAKRLADALGYKSLVTLRTWIRNKRVPEFRREDIKRALQSMKGEPNGPAGTN
jgi:hypothetical protein